MRESNLLSTLLEGQKQLSNGKTTGRSEECSTASLSWPAWSDIYVISLLPMKDVAKSATVSKKWRELWSSIPEWTLEYNSFPNMENKNEKFISFVDRVINFHQGPGIQSMKIHYMINMIQQASVQKDGSGTWLRTTLLGWTQVYMQLYNYLARCLLVCH